MKILCTKFILIITFGSISLFVTSRMMAQGLFVHGYADFEAYLSNPFGDGNSDFYFDNHHFNVVVLGEIFGDLFGSAEIEYEHAGEEVALEYGYLGYTGIKNFRIMAGKFIIPFGRFNKDLHPSWINKMVDRPHGFNNILPQTYNDVGIWLSGTFPLQQDARFIYDVYLVNGLMGEDGGDIRDMRDNDRDQFPEGGRDDSKALGARFGLELPPKGFDFGVSFYSGRYSDDPDSELNLLLLGADMAFRKSGFEIRGELVYANQEASEADLDKTGGYIQMAYLVSSRFEPVIRFSARNMPEESQDRSRFSLGANYYISPAASIRLNYHINIEKSNFKSDNDAIATQFNISF